jgi:hypothetical protein
MSTVGVSMSPQDELLRLTGTSGDPFEDVSATGNGTGKYYGTNKTVRQRLVVAGTVSGTNPTLDVKFQDSADNVTYADMGVAFAQVTASMAVATGSLAAFPLRVINTAADRPWVRVVKTIGGTASPTFNDVAVLHEMPHPF